MVKELTAQPAATWVTWVPSLRHPELVPDFARRVASSLGLPFREALRRTDNRPQQKEMENSVQQARNVDGSLAIGASSILAGPVLLIDDIVDSRWTLTVAAWLLRSNGSGEVTPVVLAQAAGG